MLKRALSLTSVVAVLFAIGLFIPAMSVAADCQPLVGTGADESFICDGNDVDGLSVGSGSDTVQIISGTVMNVILSTGGTLQVTIDGGTLSSVTNGVQIVGNGNIIVNGDVVATVTGITLSGVGDITSVGNVTGTAAFGISLAGVGDIHSTGDVHGGVAGIFLSGLGDVTSIGNITATLSGIQVIGSGNVTAEGDITASTFGIQITGSGNVTFTGNMTSAIGIFLTGAGDITVDGSITSSSIGIQGVTGNHNVDVQGTITAPIAITLGAGNDALYVRDGSSVVGAIDMGGGDDTVIVGTGAFIPSTIVGGETGEVNGDSIIFDAGQICTEDGQAVAAGQALANQLGALDPEGDTVTYLGQTYTWTQFEHIMGDAHLVPCIGRINDGRINAYDIGASDALYCTVGGGVSDWRIDLDGQGTFSFAVTLDQINAAFDTAVSSGVNQVVGSGGFDNSLYALSDGHTLAFFSPDLRESGKTYQHTFERDLCPSS